MDMVTFKKNYGFYKMGPKFQKTTYKWAKKTPHSTYILSPATHLLGHLGRGPPFAPKLPIGFHHTALQPNASGRGDDVPGVAFRFFLSEENGACLFVRCKFMENVY